MVRCLKPNCGVLVFSAWGSKDETAGYQLVPEAATACLPPELAQKLNPLKKRDEASPESLRAALLAAIGGEGANADISVQGPETRSLMTASPAAYWTRFAETSPGLRALLKELDEPMTARLRETVMEMASKHLQAEDGTTVALPVSCYFGIARLLPSVSDPPASTTTTASSSSSSNPPQPVKSKSIPSEPSGISYQQRVAATIDSQLKRAEANELFRRGDLRGAATAYEAALAEAVLDEDRLPLLSNLGFCFLKLLKQEGDGHDEKTSAALSGSASEALRAALALGCACCKAPVLAAKVAGRLLEVHRRAGDNVSFGEQRAIVAECRFYISLAVEKGAKPPALDLPPPPQMDKVTSLLMTIGQAEDEDGVLLVRAALASAAGEAMDDQRMNGLCLAVHIACLRPAIGVSLLKAVLESGTPVDARHEQGRTALMLAANNGRLDLVTLLLDHGASAAAVDGEGSNALHACCIDLNLSQERAEAGLECNPAGVVALLLKRGTPVDATTADGMTALKHCETHAKRGHEAAAACAAVLEEWAASKVLEVTRL